METVTAIKISFTAKKHPASCFSLFSDVHLFLFLEIEQIKFSIGQLFNLCGITTTTIYLNVSESVESGNYAQLISHTEVNNC